MPVMLEDRSHLPQVRRMNHRHEGLLTWLLLNPHRPLGECARDLGYSPAWVSMVVHSDMFQAIYRAECAKRNELAVHTITNKLAHLTARAIEKATEKIDSGTASERFLMETQKNSLAALGYGQKNEPAKHIHEHQHIHVDASTLIQARERAAQVHFGQSRLPASAGRDSIGPSPANVVELPGSEPEQLSLLDSGFASEPEPVRNELPSAEMFLDGLELQEACL